MPPRRRRRRRRGSDDDNDGVAYGVRSTRRRTTHHHRGSSSLDPGQMMEMDSYYDHAHVALQFSMILGRILSLLVGLHIVMERAQTQVTSFVDCLRSHVAILIKLITKINLMLKWVLSWGEMSLLYANDLTYYVRLRRSRYPPKKNRHLRDIGRDDCYSWFGILPHDLRRLYTAWRVPDTFRHPSNGQKFGGEECFLICMYHMIQGEPYTRMTKDFGGDPRHFSLMHDLMIRHLYYTFYNKISGTSLSQWIPSYLDKCRRLIYDKLHSGAIEETIYDEDGAVLDTQYIIHQFDYATFRPFGFLDDSGVPAANVGGEPTRRFNFIDDIQRVFYSGYFKEHGLKVQLVWLPIGIIGCIFITELRQNDNGVQNISGLNDYLVQLLTGWMVPAWLGSTGWLFPALYCDGIFAVLATILPRFRNPSPALKLLNLRLASLRECIEHVFADHTTRFQLFNVPWRLKLYNHGVKIRHMTLVSFFILNCYYCICGTRSTTFGQLPPTLEEYLPLNEVLYPPPAVDLGETIDFWSVSENSNENNV